MKNKVEKRIEEVKKILDEHNPYPEHLEKHHETDGSEECFWNDRNNKIAELITLQDKQ